MKRRLSLAPEAVRSKEKRIDQVDLNLEVFGAFQPMSAGIASQNLTLPRRGLAEIGSKLEQGI
jgi:hypothetical protein